MRLLVAAACRAASASVRTSRATLVSSRNLATTTLLVLNHHDSIHSQPSAGPARSSQRLRLGLLGCATAVSAAFLAQTAHSENAFEQQPGPAPHSPAGTVSEQDDSGQALLETVRTLQSGEWKHVIERCVPAIVALHIATPRSFDGDRPGAHQATGFIVGKSALL
jgi:hypothetical protein